MVIKVLKNHFRIRGLKVSERKNELMARVFVANENGAKAEVKADLKMTI